MSHICLRNPSSIRGATALKPGCRIAQAYSFFRPYRYRTPQRHIATLRREAGGSSGRYEMSYLQSRLFDLVVLPVFWRSHVTPALDAPLLPIPSTCRGPGGGEEARRMGGPAGACGRGGREGRPRGQSPFRRERLNRPPRSHERARRWRLGGDDLRGPGVEMVFGMWVRTILGRLQLAAQGV